MSKICWFMVVLMIFVNEGVTTQVSIGDQTLSNQLKQLQSQIQRVVVQGRQNIWKEIQKDQPVWNMPPWLGTYFLSQYYFELRALNITGDLKFESKFNVQLFKQKLLNQQLADGSWKQIVDLNQKQGSLDATIFNYWFLKDTGEQLNSKHMKKAKKFILDHGGIQNAQIITKFKLATFGIFQWVLLQYIPLVLFQKIVQFPSPFCFFGKICNFFNIQYYTYIKDYVAQWAYPHLTSLAYLRYHKTVFNVSNVCLQELRTSRSYFCQEYKLQHPGLSAFTHWHEDSAVNNLLEEAIKLKGPKGSFGAYTISTLLNLMSFKDYSLRYTKGQNYSDVYNITQSLQFVEDCYFNRRVPYEGSLDDGRYWDTILAVFGLLQSGESPEKVSPTMEYLINNAVQPNGGIPYGLQFEYAPDIDDTSLLLLLYGKMKKAGIESSVSYEKQINKSYDWIKSNQNTDGGFPAFDRDKNDNQYPIIKYIAQLSRIDKSAEMFDPSCPDIVGHILEGMGECDLIDQQVIMKAVEFLYHTRKSGMWSARWGINYVYAVGAVFPGLSRVGYSLNQKWLYSVIKKLQEIQQADGGFGETSESYNKDKYIEGVTTVSMTAWGLLAYLQVADLPIPDLQQSIINATKYLLNNFKQNNGMFFDRSVVGTGHRGLLNLQYPIYAYSFPLIALSRLNKIINGEFKGQQINSQLTNNINNKLQIKLIKFQMNNQLNEKNQNNQDL